MLAAGASHTCALRTDGKIVCWGLNQWGQLGVGTFCNVGTSPQHMGENLVPVDLGPGV